MDYMVNIIIGIAYIFIGLLLIGLAIPMYLGKVKMNKVYGARFKKSFESDENWYKINKYAGKLMIICSIPIVVLGVLSFFITFNIITLILYVILLIVLVLIATFQSYNYAKNQ
jgi:uncharacterized membrane protein